MKTKLQNELAQIAPHISIETIWSFDENLRDIRKDCDGFKNEDPDDWQAWQSEIRASIIVNGEIIESSAYLGGTWEKAGEHPGQSNPEISGYEPQMTEEALEGLRDTVGLNRVSAALDFVASELRRRYDEQQNQPA